MRMGAWLDKDVPVRMRIVAEVRAKASRTVAPVEAPAPQREAHKGSIMVTVGSDWDSKETLVKEVMLLCMVEVPGRPLTAAEVVDLMCPYGILPADKGGSTGLPLHVACAQAKATGGGACALSFLLSLLGADFQRPFLRTGDLPGRQLHRVRTPRAGPRRGRRRRGAGCVPRRGGRHAGAHARRAAPGAARSVTQAAPAP